MRPDRLRTDRAGPIAEPRPSATLTGSTLLTAALVTLLLLASYPAAGGVVIAAALPTRRAARAAVRHAQALWAGNGIGPVCVPGTDVCLGA